MVERPFAALCNMPERGPCVPWPSRRQDLGRPRANKEACRVGHLCRRHRGASEADLALSAKELLGTAYMFQPPRFPPPPGVQRVVEAVRKMAGVSAPARRVRPWAIAVDFRASGGLVGHSGPSVGAGGVMGIVPDLTSMSPTSQITRRPPFGAPGWQRSAVWRDVCIEPVRHRDRS